MFVCTVYTIFSTGVYVSLCLCCGHMAVGEDVLCPVEASCACAEHEPVSCCSIENIPIDHTCENLHFFFKIQDSYDKTGDNIFSRIQPSHACLLPFRVPVLEKNITLPHAFWGWQVVFLPITRGRTFLCSVHQLIFYA